MHADRSQEKAEKERKHQLNKKYQMAHPVSEQEAKEKVRVAEEKEMAILLMYLHGKQGWAGAVPKSVFQNGNR